MENEIRSSSYTLQEIQYAEDVEVFVNVLKAEEEAFVQWITELTNGQARVDCVDQQFVEFVIS